MVDPEASEGRLAKTREWGFQMADAVIIDGCRTPIGRARKGSLIDVDPVVLARTVMAGVVERTAVDPNELDDVVIAESLHGGGVMGRYAAVDLGWTHLPGLADNRHCAAGLSAVQIAASSIRAGMDQAVIAGGTESLSSMPRLLKSTPTSAGDYQPWAPITHPPTPDAPPFDMSITVGENTARERGLTREEVDGWALRSHQNAAFARDNGLFDDEIVPVLLPDGSKFTRDEHPRADTTAEKLASLAVLHPELPDATVTAGNAAGINDAAAAMLVTSDEWAAAHGMAPKARIIAWASVGIEPARTGMAPTLAIPKALARAGMSVADIDLWEINEAFCSVPAAACQVLGIDPAIVNPVGSGCGLGHPIACTGSRMVVTMMNQLRQRDLSIGCVSMCAGGGMGSALILELL
jgi:acetyl-CoA acetyltransferase family protein